MYFFRLKITPDQKHLGVAAFTDLHLYKIDSISQKPSVSYSDNKSNITDLGFEKDCKWLFTSAEDGIMHIFDLRAKGFQMKYENSCGVNTSVLHPMQTEIYFGDDKGNIGIWDLVKNEPKLLQEDPEQTAIRSLDITIDGSKLVAANSDGILFTRVAFDDHEFLPQEEIEAHYGSYILRCKFSRCGQFIAT
jgi:G protein beta subunit-like protein